MVDEVDELYRAALLLLDRLVLHLQRQLRRLPARLLRLLVDIVRHALVVEVLGPARGQAREQLEVRPLRRLRLPPASSLLTAYCFPACLRRASSSSRLFRSFSALRARRAARRAAFSRARRRAHCRSHQQQPSVHLVGSRPG